MGMFTSAKSVYISSLSDASDFTPREFIASTPKQAISRKEVSKQEVRRESFIKDVSSSLEEARKYFLIPGVTYRNPQVNVCRKSISLSDASLNHSFYSDTLTFDTGNVLSYDGMNKRLEKRDEIQMDILKAKINFGGNPNELCTHGDRTCLMCAVLANDFGYVKKLVELGVDINKTNRLGETASSLAIETNNFELTNYLPSKGAADVVLSLE